MNINYNAYAKVKKHPMTERQFIERVNDIMDAQKRDNAPAVPQQIDAGYWYLAFCEERDRANAAEARLAEIEAQISAGQLVDVRVLPQNITYTVTRRIW